MISGIAGRKISEPGACHRRCRDSVLRLDCPAVIGDTRRAAVSAPNSKYDRISPGLYLGKQLRVIKKHVAPFVPQFRLD